MLGQRASKLLFRALQQQNRHFHMTKVVESDLKVGLVGNEIIIKKNLISLIFGRTEFFS